MKNLLTRTLTGILFIGVVIFAVVKDSLILFNVFFLFTLVGLSEYKNLLKIKNIHLGNQFYILALVVYITVGYTALWTNPMLKKALPYALIAFLLLFSVIALFHKKEGTALTYVAASLSGIIAIVIPFALINHFNLIEKGNIGLIAVFILIWAYDTFAYCIGSLIGKHPLFLRISPKKTWEGTVGAALCTLIASYFFVYLFPSLSSLYAINSLMWMGLAAVVIITGTLGDLIESMFKRELGVKDSGYILPGHGGVLDRFDSILFSIPFILLYISIII